MEQLHKVIFSAIRYSSIDIKFKSSPRHFLHTSYIIPLRDEFLERRSLLVAMPASLALPPLPPHPIWNYLHVERLLGTKRGGNHCVPNLVNMFDGVTTPNWQNPEPVSRYDGLYERQRHYAAVTRQKSTKKWRFLRFAGFSLFRNMTLCHPLFVDGTKFPRVLSYYDFCTVFPVVIWMTFAFNRLALELYI